MRLACCDGAPTLHNSTQVVVASVGLLATSASGSNPSASNECSVSTKVACGRAHTGQKKCESSGCCFEKVKHSKDPWCFKPVAAPGPSTCSVSSEHKENCGYKGVHQSGCEDRGCCWETVRGDPSCFRPRPDPAQCSENPACVAAGLPGHNFCCPAEDGMRLACCDGAPTLRNSTQVVV